MNRREKALLAYIGFMLWMAALLIFAFHLMGCGAPFGQIEPNSAQAQWFHFLGGCPADTPNCVMVGGFFPPQPAVVAVEPPVDALPVVCGRTGTFISCR